MRACRRPLSAGGLRGRAPQRGPLPFRVRLRADCGPVGRRYLPEADIRIPHNGILKRHRQASYFVESCEISQSRPSVAWVKS